MIAHNDDILEAVFCHAINQSFVDFLKQVRRKGDAARHFGINTTGRIHGKRKNRRHKCVAQLSRNHWSNCARHKGVSTKNRVRPPLFGAAVIYEDSGFALLVNGLVDLGVSHQLDLDGRRILRPAKRGSDGDKHNSFHGFPVYRYAGGIGICVR